MINNLPDNRAVIAGSKLNNWQTLTGLQSAPCLSGLEWISSHQCTSCGWARWGRFADEHPPCLMCFFFHPMCFFFSPLFCPTFLPPPTLNLPPPPTYHLQTPLPPLTPSPELDLWSGSSSSRAVAVELMLWNCCCGVGVEARATTRPTRPRLGKMLTFFFCLKRQASFGASPELQQTSCRALSELGALELRNSSGALCRALMSFLQTSRVAVSKL